MKSTLLLDGAERTFVVVFDKGDEVVEGLTAFAGRESLRASQVTAIGALSDVTLGYFDRESRRYHKIPLREQVEVLSLLGVVALDGEKPKLHRPTLEVIVEESPRHLQRRRDPASGLALIDIGDRAQAA